jgi:hypothetical protein
MIRNPNREETARQILLAYNGRSRLRAVSDPVRPPGSGKVVQASCTTSFQELPWKSIVEVPWQVVPGPAAQSFWPFNATPKHSCFPAACAAVDSASVNGAAAAIDASAVVTAPAKNTELRADRIGMLFSPVCPSVNGCLSPTEFARKGSLVTSPQHKMT